MNTKVETPPFDEIADQEDELEQEREDYIEDSRNVRPALELLARLRGGNVMDLVAIEIARVVKGVSESKENKGGQVALTLKFSKVKRAHRALAIQALVVGKAPEDPPDYDLMFYDDDGGLHTTNPEQDDMFGNGPQGL